MKSMTAIEAVEKLIWMKKEHESLKGWLADLDVSGAPVNGVHWRRLKKKILSFESELIEKIILLEAEVQNEIGTTSIVIETLWPE